jgi:ABC-type Na+ efflux pump permease subunit
MIRDVLVTVVSLVWALLLLLVGARFLGLLVGANKESEIIDWIYRHSDFWVKPFFGIAGLANKAVDNTGGVFEPASLVAFIVYFLLGAFLLSLMRGGFYRSFHHA